MAFSAASLPCRRTGENDELPAAKQAVPAVPAVPAKKKRPAKSPSRERRGFFHDL